MECSSNISTLSTLKVQEGISMTLIPKSKCACRPTGGRVVYRYLLLQRYYHCFDENTPVFNLFPILTNLLSKNSSKMLMQFPEIQIHISILGPTTALLQLPSNKDTVFQIQRTKSMTPHLQTLHSNTTTQAALVYNCESPIITNTDTEQVCHNDPIQQLLKNTIQDDFPTTRQHLDP